MLYSTMILYHFLLEGKIPYKTFLSLEERQRRDRRVPRCALLPYHASSFEYIFISGNNQALINATGHDHDSFDKLLHLFRPMYRYYMFDRETGMIRKKVCDINNKPMGRSRDLSPIGGLGLVLMWYRTRGSCARSLAMMFGQTSTPMYLWLRFGRRVLLHILSRLSIAKVKMPTEQEVRPL